MHYIKIQTLWKRDEVTHKIIEGDHSKPEFGNIKKWQVTEKIDGTNIRVYFENGDTIRFGGKTDEAQVPVTLYELLLKMFPKEKFLKFYEGKDEIPKQVILYGEAYGGKIQGKNNYSETMNFILFDVYIDGWWLNRDSVVDIAEKLGIKSVPVLGMFTEEEIVKIVKTGAFSKISDQTKIFEGIVARTEPVMLFRDGTPICWKLKVKDFKK